MLYIGAGIVSAIYTPGGLTQQEIDAIQPTNDLSLSLRSLATVNLPFHLLQLASFKLLGVTILSIKLPSIILYVISSIAIFLLLRRWFKPNVVILSMLIMATTAQLLFIGQSATSGILYVFLLRQGSFGAGTDADLGASLPGASARLCDGHEELQGHEGVPCDSRHPFGGRAVEGGGCDFLHD